MPMAPPGQFVRETSRAACRGQRIPIRTVRVGGQSIRQDWAPGIFHSLLTSYNSSLIVSLSLLLFRSLSLSLSLSKPPALIDAWWFEVHGMISWRIARQLDLVYFCILTPGYGHYRSLTRGYQCFTPSGYFLSFVQLCTQSIILHPSSSAVALAQADTLCSLPFALCSFVS